MKSIRAKLANIIDPTRKNSQEYPFVELKWQSDEDYLKEAIASNHKLFEEKNGRKAISDDEAIEFTKKYVDEFILAQEKTTSQPPSNEVD